MRLRFGRSWRSRISAENAPLVFSRRESNTQRVVALDARAEALRLRIGLGVAEACAMHPSIEIVAEDSEADARLLEALADWCDRYTPLVALDGRDGLFLDITGCAHLFGGEQALLDDVTARFVRQGFDLRASIASTPGAAWAAARYAAGAIVAQDDEGDLIASMPLAALRLDAAICSSLESVGLRTSGAILTAPRAPLVRRFGKSVLLRLDQALGSVEEAISPRLPPPLLSVERRFFEPISAIADIESLIPELARQLKPDLERREEGARRLEVQLFRVDNELSRIAVSSSRPLRDPKLVGALFREKFASVAASIDPGYGFDFVRLAVITAAPFPAEQSRLDAVDNDAEGDIALFADRVRARLGGQAIRACRPAASHIPERAAVFEPFAQEGPMVSGAADNLARPLRLFRAECVEVAAAEIPEGPPHRFRWRNVSYRVVGAEGPERISPEWWRDVRLIEADKKTSPNDDTPEEEAPPDDRNRKKSPTAKPSPPPVIAMHARAASATRDYFRIEDEAGRRYWLYREGLYGEERPPRWFMQGMFA